MNENKNNEMRKIPYGKQTITENDIKEVVSVLKSDFLTQGPKIAEFEKDVAEYHNAKYAVAFSNGTAALHGAYNAIGIDDGDEIITSPITFAATGNAAIYCGGKPVLVDIDPSTNCIDIKKIEEKITDKTKAITPVSLAGYPVDLKEIREIADRHGCYIIHDAAHAIGSKRDGTFGMEYADMAMLSFHPVKHIATGEGGMILTNNKDLYEKLIRFRSHGITKDAELMTNNDGPWYYEMIELGYNYRMTDIQAALGISQFRRIGDNLWSRNKTAKSYNDGLSDCDFVETPPGMGFGILRFSDAENVHSYHLYTLKVAEGVNRLDFFNYLHSKRILAQIHYIPLYRQPYYREHFSYKPEDYPNSEDYYSREISIPMYHNMNKNDTEYVIQSIKEYGDRIK